MNIVVNALCSKNEIIGNFYQNILACTGESVPCPPVADLLRRYHHLDGEWLIVSPIYWQATHNDAMIMACNDALALTDEESRRWFTALSEFLVNDPIKLYYHDAYTWLIQIKHAPPIHARPVHELLHQSMMQQLKSLDSSLFWSRFITENQMFFSQHALNKLRSGHNPINGVWVWGQGRLVDKRSHPLYCADHICYELATLVSTNVNHYTLGESIPNNATLLCQTFDKQHVTRFEKTRVHWYWNNANYITKPKRWFDRFFGKKS